MTFVDAQLPNVEVGSLADYTILPGGAPAPLNARMKAYCVLTVGGQPVTDKLSPYLISLRIMAGLDQVVTMEIELDDRDGRLDIPAYDTPVSCELGWQSENMIQVFTGVVNDVEHGFARDGTTGRRMWVHCGLGQMASQIKGPQQGSLGFGAPPGKDTGDPVSFMAAVQKFAGTAGLSASVHPSLASIMRDFWSINNESVIHWGQRMAKDFGAIFNVAAGNAVFTILGQNPDGSNTGMINAVWGSNLISWRLRPFAARAMWKQGNQFYHDRLNGAWKFLSQGLSGLGNAVYALPAPAPNNQVGGQQTSGLQAYQAKGGGRVCINGEPSALPNMTLNIIGARPGVDGLWRINSVEHRWSRQQGFTTWIEPFPLDSAQVLAINGAATTASAGSYSTPSAYEDVGTAYEDFQSTQTTPAPAGWQDPNNALLPWPADDTGSSTDNSIPTDI